MTIKSAYFFASWHDKRAGFPLLGPQQSLKLASRRAKLESKRHGVAMVHRANGQAVQRWVDGELTLDGT